MNFKQLTYEIFCDNFDHSLKYAEFDNEGKFKSIVIKCDEIWYKIEPINQQWINQMVKILQKLEVESEQEAINRISKK